MKAFLVRQRVMLSIILIMVIGTVAAYQFTSVEVSYGTIFRCSDPKHEGNPVLEDTTSTKFVFRKDRSNYAIARNTKTCQNCTLRQEEEKRVADKRRQQEEARAREQKQIRQVLDSFRPINFLIGGESAPTRKKPGDRISFTGMGENIGNKPLTGLRFKIEPWGECLDIGCEEELSGSHISFTVPEWKFQFNEMQTKGLPVYGRVKNDGKTLLPVNDPMYTPDTWKLWSSYGAYQRTKQPSQDGFTRLRLKPSVSPGQSIEFVGYIIYQGERKRLGSVTVHVIHE